MKKVAVLGGTHFIGVHLHEALQREGHQVTLYNRNLTTAPIALPKDITHITGDRNNPEDLRKLFKEDFDVVFDLSGYALDHVEPIALNYRSSIGHYIFCSTSLVHKPPASSSAPLNESSPRVFEQNTYGGNKALVEDLLLKQYDDHQWPITIFRPHGIFGPYSPWKAGFIFYRLTHSLPIFIINDSNFRLNPFLVDDLIAAFLLAMQKPISHGSVYGVAGNEVTSPFDFTELCGKICESRHIVRYVESTNVCENAEIGLPWWGYNFILNNAKIKTELGLKFTPLNGALNKTFQWLNDNPAYLKHHSFFGERYILKNHPVPKFAKIYLKILEKLAWGKNNLIRLGKLRRVLKFLPYTQGRGRNK